MTSFVPPRPPAGQLGGTNATAHPVAPPPSNSQIIRDVAATLALTGAGITAALVATTIASILKPYGVSQRAVTGALMALEGTSTKHRPNARLAVNEIFARAGASIPADFVQAQADEELFYRAAFVIKTAKRVQASLNGDITLDDALDKVVPLVRAHESARKNRMDAAAAVGKAMVEHGPLLGWYVDWSSHSEPECQAADGNNFDPMVGTIIGYPGAVHPHCHCFSGPPHALGGMVDDAVKGIVKRISTNKLLGLRRVS